MVTACPGRRRRGSEGSKKNYIGMAWDFWSPSIQPVVNRAAEQDEGKNSRYDRVRGEEQEPMLRQEATNQSSAVQCVIFRDLQNKQHHQVATFEIAKTHSHSKLRWPAQTNLRSHPLSFL